MQIHRGTGRLWAVLIQLMQFHGESAQLRVFKAAQEEVPKSGEVWCEGARIFLNPLSKHFNLDIAQRFLDWAVQFTPQYGDSFLELLRLRLLQQGPQADLQQLEQVRRANCRCVVQWWVHARSGKDSGWGCREPHWLI